MAITSLDGAIAGFQPPQDFMKFPNSGAQATGRFYSLFYAPGVPGAAVAPSPGIAGAALTSYSGQIPFVNGASNQYLARFAGNSGTTNAGTMFLCDRLWHNSGISVTTTGNQTIDSVAWPARDMNGSTNGEGVRIGLEVSTATGAGASVINLSGYTNQAGTASRVGSARIGYSASSILGAFYDFSLQAGDTGVRSIQTYGSTVSMTSGAVHLVAYRVLARIPMLTAYVDSAVDVLSSGMPKLHDDTVPFLLFLPGSTGAIAWASGQLIQSNG